MRVDYELTQRFNFEEKEGGGPSFVSGREEFEQTIALRLTEAMDHLVSEPGVDTVEQKLRRRVIQVAKNYDLLDEVTTIDIERNHEEGGWRVEIVYLTNEQFSTIIRS